MPNEGTSSLTNSRIRRLSQPFLFDAIAIESFDLIYHLGRQQNDGELDPFFFSC